MAKKLNGREVAALAAFDSSPSLMGIKGSPPPALPPRSGSEGNSIGAGRVQELQQQLDLKKKLENCSPNTSFVPSEGSPRPNGKKLPPAIPPRPNPLPKSASEEGTNGVLEGYSDGRQKRVLVLPTQSSPSCSSPVTSPRDKEKCPQISTTTITTTTTGQEHTQMTTAVATTLPSPIDPLLDPSDPLFKPKEHLSRALREFVKTELTCNFNYWVVSQIRQLFSNILIADPENKYFKTLSKYYKMLSKTRKELTPSVLKPREMTGIEAIGSVLQAIANVKACSDARLLLCKVKEFPSLKDVNIEERVSLPNWYNSMIDDIAERSMPAPGSTVTRSELIKYFKGLKEQQPYLNVLTFQSIYNDFRKKFLTEKQLKKFDVFEKELISIVLKTKVNLTFDFYFSTAFQRITKVPLLLNSFIKSIDDVLELIAAEEKQPWEEEKKAWKEIYETAATFSDRIQAKVGDTKKIEETVASLNKLDEKRRWAKNLSETEVPPEVMFTSASDTVLRGRKNSILQRIRGNE